MMRARGVFFYCALFTLTACSGGTSGNNSGGGSSDPCNGLNFTGSANSSFSASNSLTASPVALGNIASITPLGNLNAPYHIYPTDHMFLILSNSAADANNVYAAGTGTVILLYQPGGGPADKLVIQVDSSFYYYYDHIHAASGIAVGSKVSAGQLIGTNSGDAAAVDFGAYNFNTPSLTGILNTCALETEAHVDSPLKYYPTGTIRDSLYGKITVSGGATQDGKIDYDQAGKLVGNWILTGHMPIDNPPIYSLAFTYNVKNHGLRVSIGGTLSGGAGTFAVQNGAVDFASITAASGKVDYQLFPTCCGDGGSPGTQTGVISVQVLSDTQIKVEVFLGSSLSTGTFDSSALIYQR